MDSRNRFAAGGQHENGHDSRIQFFGLLQHWQEVSDHEVEIMDGYPVRGGFLPRFCCDSVALFFED